MDIGHGKTVIFDPKQNEFVCIVRAWKRVLCCVLKWNDITTTKKRGSYHCSNHHGTNHEIT